MCRDIIHRYFIPHCNRKKQFHQVRENFIDEFSLQCFSFFYLFKNPTIYATFYVLFSSQIFLLHVIYCYLHTSLTTLQDFSF